MTHQAQPQADGHPGIPTIADRVIEVIADELGHAVDQVRLEQHIGDDLGADSLDVIELTLGIEEAFDLEIPDEDVPALRTVEDVVSYIGRRLAPQAITG